MTRVSRIFHIPDLGQGVNILIILVHKKILNTLVIILLTTLSLALSFLLSLKVLLHGLIQNLNKLLHSWLSQTSNSQNLDTPGDTGQKLCQDLILWLGIHSLEKLRQNEAPHLLEILRPLNLGALEEEGQALGSSSPHTVMEVEF